MFNRIKEYQKDSSIYVLGLTQKEKAKSARRNLLYVSTVALSQVLAGMVNQASSRTAWVVYPYLAIFLPLAYAFMGVGAYWRASCRMSSTQYQEGLLRIRRSLLAILVLAVLGVGLEIWYLILHWKSVPLFPELLYIALHIPHIVGVAAYGRFYDRTFTGIIRER